MWLVAVLCGCAGLAMGAQLFYMRLVLHSTCVWSHQVCTQGCFVYERQVLRDCQFLSATVAHAPPCGAPPPPHLPACRAV
jgi:hypothetical protein